MPSEMPNIIKISVRNLVEFILRQGDLSSGFSAGASRALEGTKAHIKIQKSMPKEYTAEVHLSHTIAFDEFSIEISGRADGIIINRDNEVIIDEIKTTTTELEYIDEFYNPLHIAQAKCYGYIYSLQNNIPSIKIQLTYYNLDTKEIKNIVNEFSFEELEAFFHMLIEKYSSWARIIFNWTEERDNSIKSLAFPFSSYRKGQRNFVIAVYKSIENGHNLYAQAPTGTGKTIATLFPAIKAMGEGHLDKIFYLTAKTITREIAENTINKLKNDGLVFRNLTLTAKEKICFKNEKNCDPEICEYAKGYYDRVNDALWDIMKEHSLTRCIIEQYSTKYTICPFEFSLDLSLWSDCIICDYNYVFDPRVYLKRFFMDTKGDYCFLIDEAHNMVDRSREMFSSQLSKSTFTKLRKEIKDDIPRLYKTITKISAEFTKLKKQCTHKESGSSKEEYLIQPEMPYELTGHLRSFLTIAEKWFAQNMETPFHDELLQLYFDVTSFVRTSETYDDHYVTYAISKDKEVFVKLFCLDPSLLIGEALKRGKSAIFFSATLTPLNYFLSILGGNDNDKKMKIPSPFPKENLCLLLADNISTKYKNRHTTYSTIADMILETIQKKRGNYLVFFPSYKYMEEVHSRFEALEHGEVEVILQYPDMQEAEREAFLEKFSEANTTTLLGFAVMGGIFGEGIDLTGDRLCGTIIVGVGLPQVCLERDIIKSYFDENDNMGFEYAYIYPAMNKVLQSAGRVIRTETDRGVVLLIDERFSYPQYCKLYPDEWYPVPRIRKKAELNLLLENFWNSTP